MFYMEPLGFILICLDKTNYTKCIFECMLIITKFKKCVLENIYLDHVMY